MDNHDLIIEIFPNKEAAERAFNIAVELGYKPDDINVVMSKDSRHQYYPDQSEAEIEPAKGLASGGILGGTIGSTIGALIALGTNFALPGLGLIMVGPLVASGGLSGGLFGSLIGWGTTENTQSAYEEQLKKGR